ncbi:macrosialin [Labeo rohita]|uniref:macrosialin n=1 Tax=Labeo rohita TaxID=84645 RepID=UPI0021E2D849|nr:macrosialin [Labeo rohita]
MKHGLLFIALFIAATALTSGEYSSSYMSGTSNSTTQATNTTTQATNTTTQALNTTTHAPKTTTHAPNTTTHAPNTTTQATNTTTHAPKTTTHAPNTTTHAPNTTTHAPNTTTHNPNTTTHSPPTTTAMPVPTPPTNVTTGKYNFTDGKGIPCIMMDMAIGIRVNTSGVNGTFIVQPSKTNVSGECQEKVATLTLTFDEGSISVQFQKNETTKKAYLRFVQYDLTYAFKTGVLSNYSSENRSLELFSVDLGHSYSCHAETLYMGNGVSLDLTHNRFQAFDIKDKQFGPPELCKADQPDYRVPIAVGIILIILIVIVVIAYLISRKRRTDGYQSL